MVLVHLLRNFQNNDKTDPKPSESDNIKKARSWSRETNSQKLANTAENFSPAFF